MLRPLSCILVILSTLFFGHASGQVISTYAGDGDTTAGYVGDGGPAKFAKLRKPNGIAVDETGNLYIADAGNNCIRKVDTFGIITTIAGTGVAGYNGDTIPAITAKLSNPLSVAADRFGNIYFTDGGNTRLRKIDAAGIITTVYHDPLCSTIAMTVAVNRNGVVYFSSNYNIYKMFMGYPWLITSSSIVPVTFMSLNGMVFDTSGNLFVANAEGAAGSLLKMDTSAHFTLLAGDGACGFYCQDSIGAFSTGLYGLTGVARDDAGNIYFAETTNGRIIKKLPSGLLVTYAGNCTGSWHSGDGGYPKAAQVDIDHNCYNPIALDKKGNLYIVEPNFNCVRKVSPTGTPALMVKEISNEHSINVFPNPSDGVCHIRISSAKQESVTVTVVDVAGETLETFDTKTNIDCERQFHVPPGTYIITAKTAGDVVSATKLIVR